MEETNVEAMFRDWTSLPGDLLTSIGEQLGLPGRQCFRCVCRSWRAALPAMPSPWLVIPDGVNLTERDQFTLLSLQSSSPFRWKFPGQRCIGSGGGWLAFIDINLYITLVNPLSDARLAVRLPSIPLKGDNNPFTNEFVRRVAFAPNPTAQDYAVAVICRYDHGMAFTRAGRKGWQWLDWPVAPGRAHPEDDDYDDDHKELFYVNYDLDLVYHGGKFYYMTLSGQIWTFDAAEPSPVTPVWVAKWRPPGPDYRHYVKHLVCTDDEALYVVWSDMPGFTEPLRDRPMRMRVKRYDLIVQRWRKVRHLGGRAFLIGHRSQSVAVPASSPSSWLRPNCVYFTNITPATENRSELPEEMDEVWEFDVEAGTFRSCDRGGVEFSSWMDWPRAIWFTPRMESTGRSTHEMVPMSWMISNC